MISDICIPRHAGVVMRGLHRLPYIRCFVLFVCGVDGRHRAPTAPPPQVEETVAGIKAVPVNAQAAAKQKADDLVAYVKNIPDTVANAAKVLFFFSSCALLLSCDLGIGCLYACVRVYAPSPCV